MNTIFTTPDVKLFVTAVRDHLGDLTEEEREELVGGLEGDMSDLVAERGVEALPEPAEYAAELRSAAGFSPVAAPGRAAHHDLHVRATAWLDRGGATWRGWVETRDHFGVPAFLHSLRPVWWVVRALVAAELTNALLGIDRAVAAGVFTIVSVQLGRGAWWPGTRLDRSLALRLLMIALNLLALVLLPAAFARFAPAGYPESTPVSISGSAGLSFRGEPIANVYPYDALGRPLTGVQLVDQDGRRLPVSREQYDESTGAQIRLKPWQNGRTELYSVFPLPQRSDGATVDMPEDMRVQSPPFASLPPVTLAGVQPSVLLSPAQVEARRRAAALDSRKSRGR